MPRSPVLRVLCILAALRAHPLVLAGAALEETIHFHTGALAADAVGNTAGLAGFGEPDPAFTVIEHDDQPIVLFPAWTTPTFVDFQQWGTFHVIPDTGAIGPTP